MLNKTTRIGFLVCLVCLLSGSLASVMALNLNETDETNDPEYPSGRVSSPPAAPLPLASIPCVDGMADIYPCNNIDLMAFMPFSQLGTVVTTTTNANDIWGWTDPETGDEYALAGMWDGTSFVRITDPENPVLLGFLPTHTDPSSWHDIKVYNNHAFIVSEAPGHGMQVFDLTQLSAITATTSVSPTTIFTHTAHYGDFGNAHNIAINEETGYAYVVGAGRDLAEFGQDTVTGICKGGLHFVNISDPLNPQNEGCFDEDGYTHDAQCVIYNGLDEEHVGKEICFNANEDTLTIVDVTDKSDPIMLSRTPGFTGCIAFNNCYTHQGWLTIDHTYFLLNDEFDEQRNGLPTSTYIWNVTDLEMPVTETVYAPGNTSADHNLYTRGSSAFLSNYTSGLRVVNISDPTTPLEIGYFDVYPEDDFPNYEGAWSNYPYFDSGTIIVSSIDRGLFILKPKPFAVTVTDSVLTSCDGAPIATNLNVHSFYESADIVTLSTRSMVGDGTAAFSATDVPFGDVAEVTLTPPTSGENGVFQIVGTSGEASSIAEITIIQNPPTAVSLGAPLNFAGISSRINTFSWEPGILADSYLLEISDTLDFANVIFSAEVAGTSRTVENLPVNQELYWRVSTVNACGSTPSAVQTVISLETTDTCDIIYSEDFESGDPEEIGWRFFVIAPEFDYYAGEDPTLLWELGATGAYSSTAGWSYTDTVRSHQVLYMPGQSFDPATAISATVKFLQKRNLGADDVMMATLYSYDTGNYITLPNETLSDPYDMGSTDWITEGIPYIDESFEVFGWSGVQDWTETTIDMTPYIGDGLIEMNFLAFTGNDPSGEGGVWAIDDFSLELCSDLPIPVDLSTFSEKYGAAWHGGDGSQYIGASWSRDVVITNTDISDDVVFPTLDVESTNSVSVTVAQDGWLMGWFDWNGDGQFGDDELVIDQAVVASANELDIDVPAETSENGIRYRLRVTLDSASPRLSPAGSAADGEVEDGVVRLSTTTATMMTQQSVNTVMYTNIPLIILFLLFVTMLVGTAAVTVKQP